MTLSAVVVGCGRIGSEYDIGRRGAPRSHAGAYRSRDDIRLVGGVDPDPARRASFERRWRAPAFASVSELVARERPDLWSICTPAEERLDIVREALIQGARGIWCEKPLAATAASGAELARLVEGAGVPLVLNYSRRWDAGHRSVAASITEGRFGRLEHAVVHYTRGIRNYGSHAIDLLCWYFGEPAWARAVPGHDRETPDPSPVALLGYAEGVVATLLPVHRASYDVFEVDLFGSEARVTLADMGRRITVSAVERAPDWREERTLGRPRRAFAGALAGTLRAALADVVAAVIGGGTPACTAADGVTALRIAEAIERAAASGATITLSGPAG